MVDLSDTAALVLAAGLSRRFGPDNKLLSLHEGMPLLRHGLETLIKAGPGTICVVTGHEAKSVGAIADELGLPTLFNPDYAQGIGTSIAAGARFLLKTPRPVFVVPGDMPRLPAGIFARLAENLTDAMAICRPVIGGEPGHPVLFGAAHLPALAALAGDEGARDIVRANTAHLRAIASDDPNLLFDVDTRS